MKKFANPKSIPYIVMGGSVIALLLRLWSLGDGPDENGLYAASPVAWALLWLVTAVVIVSAVVAVRPLKKSGSYRENYPRSAAGLVGYVLAGGSFLLSGWQQLSQITGVVDEVTAIAGLVAGVVMLVLGVYRLLGRKPNFLLHGLVCLYFAIRLFNRCQLWSNEPQTVLIVMPFLATLCLMLSTYHRTCFDVELGNRWRSLFWSFLSSFFCIVAVLSFQEILFYGACALWQMTDLCSLRADKRKKPVLPEEPETPEE